MSKIILQNSQVIDLCADKSEDLGSDKIVYISYFVNYTIFSSDAVSWNEVYYTYMITAYNKITKRTFDADYPIQSIEFKSQNFHFSNNCTKFKGNFPKFNVIIGDKSKFTNNINLPESVRCIADIIMEKNTQFEFSITKGIKYNITSPKDNLIIRNISHIHKICLFLNKKFDNAGKVIANIECKEFHALREFDKLTEDEKSILSIFDIDTSTINKYNADNFLKIYSISQNNLVGSIFGDLPWELFVPIGQQVEGKVAI